MPDKSDPKVERSTSGIAPRLPEGLGGTLHTTTFTNPETGESVSRSGHSREEADQKAGDDYKDGKRD